MPLIPNDQQTPEYRRERARRAGIASGKAKRAKKMMEEISLKMLNSALNADNKKKLKDFNLLGKNDLNYNAAIIAKHIVQAMNGDVRSANFIMEVSGQTPTQKHEIDGTMENTNHDEIVIAKDELTAEMYKRIMSGDNGD